MKSYRMVVILAVLLAVTASITIAQTPARQETPVRVTQRNQNVAQLIRVNPRTSQLESVLERAGMLSELEGQGPFTVFAPVDSAFNRIPQETRQDLLSARNQQRLQEILSYHVVQGRRYSVNDLRQGQTISMANGQQVRVRQEGNTLYVGNAEILRIGEVGTNGIVYYIDTILVPGTQDGNGILGTPQGAPMSPRPDGTPAPGATPRR